MGEIGPQNTHALIKRKIYVKIVAILLVKINHVE